MFGRTLKANPSTRALLLILALALFNFVASHSSAQQADNEAKLPIVGSPINDPKNGQPDGSNSLVGAEVGEVSWVRWSRTTPVTPGAVEYCQVSTNANYARLSLNVNGPFSASLISNVPYYSDGSGQYGLGSTPLIYIYGVAPINSLAVTLTCPVTFNTTYYLNILPATGPTPTPTPTQTPEDPHVYIRIGGATAIGVEEMLPARVEVSGGRPNYTGFIRALVSTANVNGTYIPHYFGLIVPGTASLQSNVLIPISLDSTGRGSSDQFYVKGIKASANKQPIYARYSDGPIERSDTEYIDIVNVQSVTVTRDTGQVPFDTNPNTGGGLRIYPEKKTPTDTSFGRNKFTVRAKLSKPLAGVKIDFKIVDPDDPTQEFVVEGDPTRLTDIDPNLDGDNDNRDPSALYPMGLNGLTNSLGEAQMFVQMSSKPGDNIRVIAHARPNPLSGSSSYFGGVYTNANDAYFQGAVIGETAGPTVAGATTPMITTWRSLHIERDSLGVVSGNVTTRTVTSIRTNTNGTSDLTISGGHLEDRRFEGGRVAYVVLPTPLSFNIKTNTTNTITVKGTTVPSSIIGRTVTIYDDDDADRDDETLTGDNGQDVPMPDNGLLQESDEGPDNMFAIAFIKPKYDLGAGSYDNDLPFFLNTPKAVATRDYPTDEEAMSMMEFDNVSLRKDKEFWTIYLFGAYQGAVNQDSDPKYDADSNGLESYIGYANPKVGALCLIEEMSDEANHGVWDPTDPGFDPRYDERYVPLHEVGHLLRLSHDDGGFMQLGNPINRYYFTGVSINKMRSIDVPWMADH